MTQLLQAPLSWGRAKQSPVAVPGLDATRPRWQHTSREWCWLEDDKPHVSVRGTLAVPPKTHFGS